MERWDLTLEDPALSLLLTSLVTLGKSLPYSESLLPKNVKWLIM